MRIKNETSALGYLTKLKEKEYEIEYLKREVDHVINDYNSLVDKFNQLKSENKQLKAENEELTKVVSSNMYEFIDDIKKVENAREAWERQAQIDMLKGLKEKMKYLNDDTADVIRIIINETLEALEQ